MSNMCRMAGLRYEGARFEDVAQTFRSARAPYGRPEGLRYEGARSATCRCIFAVLIARLSAAAAIQLQSGLFEQPDAMIGSVWRNCV
jgi:hypothetical protein